MTFVPYYSFNNLGISEFQLVSNGTVIASFSHCTYVDAVFSDGYKINISTKKEVKNEVNLSGGLAIADADREKVQKAAKEYIEEHLDYFKEQAFTMMPEAKNATLICVVNPILSGNTIGYAEFFPDNT